ncbi:hypothetical protein [Streptomyces albofaciens]|uniref:hypothetical protein n=1 Tax=Streptomyces albofaciens TaxID=66866 RepID=UPI001AD77B80|nr:hypothetical protein [Streptomyces albofaciens]
MCHPIAGHGGPLRLLPWTTPTGGACYLDTDDPGSLLSAVADEAEEELLRAAEALVAESGPTPVPAGADSSWELCRVLIRYDRALRDVLRIAVSRGARLAQTGERPCDHGATERCGGKTFCCGCRRQIYL